MEPIQDQAIEVPLQDLHLIRAALNSAYHHSTVLDLADQYRKLQQRPTSTKLTQALQNALTLTLSYIELARNAETEDAHDESAA